MTEDLLAQLVAGIDAVLPEAASLRRAIHADPHLGGDESDTRDAVTAAAPWIDWLPVAETGAFGRLGPAGPAVGLRAELDALPITEATEVEWASQRRGIMHACGHDVHIAGLWALLAAIQDADAPLPVGLVPILQPREECNPPGATDVVASGLLEDENIAAMVGVHVQPAVERGVVSTGAGPVNAAFDTFQITVTGRGGHGAYPHLAVDPITTLATIIAALPETQARVINPIHSSVVSVGTIRGGTADNVIADTATCTGTMRTFHEADRAALQGAMTRLAEGLAFARGASASVAFRRGGPALVNSEPVVERTDAALTGLGIPVAGEPFRSCGSDDFSEYGDSVPSLMSFIGTGPVEGVGLHHAKFLPGRDALRLCAVTFAASYVAAADFVRF